MGGSWRKHVIFAPVWLRLRNIARIAIAIVTLNSPLEHRANPLPGWITKKLQRLSPSFPVAAKEEDPDEKVDTADTETDPAHRESNNGGRQDKEESSVESKEKDLSDLKNQKRNDDDNNDKDVLEEHSQKL